MSNNIVEIINNNRKRAGSDASNGYGTFKVRYASEAQQKYIAKLLNQRIHEFINLVPEQVNLKHASDIISYLMTCPIKVETLPAPSVRQMEFIEQLASKSEEGKKLVFEFLDSLQEQGIAYTTHHASMLIEKLKRMPVTVAPREVSVTVGAYKHNGEVYSVRRSRESGKLHAYKFNGNDWVYAGNVKYELKQTERMTLEQALAFGASTGVCIHCGRTLTEPKAVVRGMGATCAKRYDSI
jgi:Family of unknown function (DUF6011)